MKQEAMKQEVMRQEVMKQEVRKQEVMKQEVIELAKEVEIHERINERVCKEGLLDIKADEDIEKTIVQAYKDGHEFARLLYAQMIVQGSPEEACQALKSFLEKN